MTRTVNLSLKNVNPFVNKKYRKVFYENKGTLNGVYTDNLINDINLFLEYHEGRIGVEGDTNFEEYTLPTIHHTHKSIKSQDKIFRRNETEDFTRVLIRNLPPETVESIDRVAWKVFGRAHGNTSRVITNAMIFGLKLRKGVTRIKEESIGHAETIIRDKRISPLHGDIFELKEEIKFMKNIIIDFFKESKTFKASKKYINNFKSKKRSKRVFDIVNSLKMINKHSFSEEEYSEMVDLQYGISDLRTVRGDLQAAQRRKLVTMRHSKYYFIDNDLYDSVHSPDARRIFNEKIKLKLREFKEISLNMFKDLVKNLTGLFDDKSIMNRLEALVNIGWLTPLNSYSNIFSVHLD